jgi:hypothetical protein
VKSEKVDIQMSGIIDATYLPFTEDELRPHFLRGPDEQISHFTESARRYHEFFNENNLDVRQDRARGPCQIEKDERFWTATALKKLVEAPDGVDLLAALLSKAFDSPRPPLAAFDDWRNCLTGNLHLALEASLPSPPSYCSWLRENGSRQHFIPYVGRAREHNTGGNLEGATSVDAAQNWDLTNPESCDILLVYHRPGLSGRWPFMPWQSRAKSGALPADGRQAGAVPQL